MAAKKLELTWQGEIFLSLNHYLFHTDIRESRPFDKDSEGASQ